MIGLYYFLKEAGIAFNPDKTKVHLACWNGHEHPIDEYYAGRFKNWQEDQGRQNFKCQQILSLIDLGQGDWLFVYNVLGCKSKSQGGFTYSTNLLPRQEELIGRIIVHHKRSRNSYIWWKDELAFPIVEIRRKKLSVEKFPGYNAIILRHSKLRIITDQKIASWHGALSNIKGVYLITDTSTGKHYVGKASGNDGIWQRWSSYAKDGHGGNAELKKLLNDIGPEHKKHLQYSILEIADSHASDLDILARESYWMNVLLSREFGLN